MNKYETIFIVNPDVESQDVENIIKQVQDRISENAGVITKVDNWGKKRLAYEVKGNKDGIYVIINFEADPQIIPTLARHYELDELIIKYMTVRAEKLLEPEMTTGADEKRSSRRFDDDDEDDDDEDEEE